MFYTVSFDVSPTLIAVAGSGPVTPVNGKSPIDLTASIIDLTTPSVSSTSPPPESIATSVAVSPDDDTHASGSLAAQSQHSSHASSAANAASQKDPNTYSQIAQSRSGAMEVDSEKSASPPMKDKGKKRRLDPPSPVRPRRNTRRGAPADKSSSSAPPPATKDPRLRSTWVLKGKDGDLSDADLAKM